MCGIAGMLLAEGRDVPVDLLRAMGAALNHRGPDHFAMFAHGKLGLAYTRLSIMDLSDRGNQPFLDDGHALVYNGEIYNCASLREDLERRGVPFRSTSDTEVLFQSLVHDGIDETLRRIRGMFAFCYCDIGDGIVYLCRDRYGIKPLVWTSGDHGTLWASEVKALRAAARIEVDPVKTLFSLSGMSEYSPETTIFRDVHHVEPGTYLVLRPGQAPSPVRYYELGDEVDPSYHAHLEDLPDDRVIEEFSSRLGAGTQSMLMSDAPIGAFVSGGIDSSLVSAIAAKHDPRIGLFSSDIVGKFSELDDATLLGEHLGLPLHVSTFRPEHMIAGWTRATYHYEYPVITHPNSMPLAAVAELARLHGVKAVLTGEGSDELFLGYAGIHAAWIQRAAHLPVRLYQSLFGATPRLKQFVFPESVQSEYDFLGKLAHGMERQMSLESDISRFRFLKEPEAREQALTLQLMRYHLVTLLHRNDRMGMLASIESRFPYLDEEMVRFGVNLPLRWKKARTFRLFDPKHPFVIDKRIVRETASRLLPPRIWRKRKMGFPTYGHPYMRVTPGYFRNGYVAEMLELSARSEEYMIRSQPPVNIAKLVAVDVFGRLFALGESQEQITARLQSMVRNVMATG